MKTEIERFEPSEITNKYKQCKAWQFEMETWKDRIQFMKNRLIQMLGEIEDENRKIEARSFFNELDGRLKGNLEWLINKLDDHEFCLKSFFKESNLKTVSEVRSRHDFYTREVLIFRDKYTEMRADFFELIKPILRNSSGQDQLKSVA